MKASDREEVFWMPAIPLLLAAADIGFVSL